MSSKRMIGTVLVVVGIILLVIGMNTSHSVADQVTKTFTGRFTDATTWYIIAGIAAALFGGMLALSGGERGRRV